jgi:dihydroorotate dehydrogenase
MYKRLFRPLLFLLDPERVHHLVVCAVKLMDKIPGFHNGMIRFTQDSDKVCSTTVAGLHFKNRVGLAAGFDKNADFYQEFSMFGFSFIEIGTVTPESQAGNPKPRLFRLKKDHALINRMGFNNKGVDYAVNKLRKRNKSLVIGGNIGKNTDTTHEDAADDYAICFEKLYNAVDYLAVNVSCPNIAGMEKLQDMDSLRKILTRILKIRAEQVLYKPVFLKISPELSFRQIDDVIGICSEVGLDGIIATNTTTSREGLSENSNRVKEIGSGGMSGKPLQNRTLEIVRYICKHTEGRLPVIGVGGINTAEDAMNMIMAGACLLQLYTGFIYEGPFLVRKINCALEKYYSSAAYNSIGGNVV